MRSVVAAFTTGIFRRFLLRSSTMSYVKKARQCSSELPDQDRLVWVDLEMTGLDVNNDHIIEMACLITDQNLAVVAEGPNLIIHQSEEVLQNMNEWCIEHHGKSGLTQAVRDSKVSLKEAEMQMVSLLRQHTPPGKCPLAGNTVHVDRQFLEKHMPQFMKHLHYRIVDVSSIKELCRRWYPKKYKAAPRKKTTHRALEDIRESIQELQYYRENVFKQSDGKNSGDGGTND